MEHHAVPSVEGDDVARAGSRAADGVRRAFVEGHAIAAVAQGAGAVLVGADVVAVPRASVPA